MSFMNIDTKVKDFFNDNPNPSLLEECKFRNKLFANLHDEYWPSDELHALPNKIFKIMEDVKTYRITVPKQERPRPKASDLPATVRSAQVLNRKSSTVYGYRVKLHDKPGIFYALSLADIKRNTLTPSSYIRR